MNDSKKQVIRWVCGGLAALLLAAAIAILFPALTQPGNALEAGEEMMAEEEETARSMPTAAPTQRPTAMPSPTPTAVPMLSPAPNPTQRPAAEPTAVPTAKPTAVPTAVPTPIPTAKPAPTAAPKPAPTAAPKPNPTAAPVQHYHGNGSDAGVCPACGQSYSAYVPILDDTSADVEDLT